MKRVFIITIYFVFALVCGVPTVSSQLSIGSILRMIEENNKELQANCQLMTLQKLEAKTNNNLPDPSVSYVHQYGNKKESGVQGELIASQSFDFPTLYVQRNQLSKIKTKSYDSQYAGLRQKVLLKAKEICLDLISLNQQEELLKNRLANAERLSELYAKRMKNGDVSILETNKIDLELLNMRTRVRRNKADHLQKQKELTSLNGGVPVHFYELTYEYDGGLPLLDDLHAEIPTVDPQLLILKNEREVARQTLNVNKSQWLPGFELGYRLNTAARGERFNGFLVGVSIPLFSNRHQVNKAKVAQLYSELQYENASVKLENELFQLYNQSVMLKESIEEYNQLLQDRNDLILLNKALEAGQISIIEYFAEISSYYDSRGNLMQLENEYQKIVARLLQHRL